MRLLLVGPAGPGSLLRSLANGFAAICEVTIASPSAPTDSHERRTVPSRALRRLMSPRRSTALVEMGEQLQPDVTLVIKGRGIDPSVVMAARRHSRIAIYYPDNPFWDFADSGDAVARLGAADLAVIWSHRLRDAVAPGCRRAAFVPFGYDDRWFPLTDPMSARQGVAFYGTWHPRRERYLQALGGLPLTIVGNGWQRATTLRAAAPSYERDAGSFLQRAAIGINVYHPHNAGAHNMRTREIAASGALQLTDPGTDGTPLRDGDGCRWFQSPGHLRELVEHYLKRPTEASQIAARAQQIAGADTYRRQARELMPLLEGL